MPDKQEDPKIALQKIRIDVGSTKLTYPSKFAAYIEEMGDAFVSSTHMNDSSYVMFLPKKLKIKSRELKDLKVTDGKADIVGGDNKVETVVDFDIKSIVLPIRPVSDRLENDWQTVEGADFSSLGQFLKWKLYKTGMGVLSTLLPEPVAMAFKTGHIGGIAMDNPHDKLMYGGTSRRSFPLEWAFLKPDNKQDEKVLNYIIEIFRIFSVGARGDYILTAPPCFDVVFVSHPNYEKFLHYKNVVITACEVKFGGDGEGFEAMEGGQPFMSLSLQLQELNYISRKNVLLNSKKGGIRMVEWNETN